MVPVEAVIKRVANCAFPLKYEMLPNLLRNGRTVFPQFCSDLLKRLSIVQTRLDDNTSVQVKMLLICHEITPLLELVGRGLLSSILYSILA